MPKKPPTPCRHHGCKELLDEPGYCEAHQRESVGWLDDRQRGNRHQRGYGTRWDKLRKLILARDNGMCQTCKRDGRVRPGNMVDHKVNKAAGGTDDPGNLEAICRACHALKTGRESHGIPGGR
ncbi:HNH endonuclease [Burkholderia plantarii]|uniref:HNH endonuclease n=1 Tax=Burkholderia plantarii TaxID=41899 RepID=UPI00272D3A78|nr:HNH endonuclease [Burkholderia plantarii]WLE60246.1 HNH endonuclease [Burkholderia plantarii]